MPPVIEREAQERVPATPRGAGGGAASPPGPPRSPTAACSRRRPWPPTCPRTPRCSTRRSSARCWPSSACARSRRRATASTPRRSGSPAGSSRAIPRTVDYVEERSPVGNLYVNREITGAMVGRQPFGGNRLSGTGTKAGGPAYLLQFVEPRVVTENTCATGWSYAASAKRCSQRPATVPPVRSAVVAYERRVHRGALTPLHEDLSLDRAAFAAHCRGLIDDGCHGLGTSAPPARPIRSRCRAQSEPWKALVKAGLPDQLLPGTGLARARHHRAHAALPCRSARPGRHAAALLLQGRHRRWPVRAYSQIIEGVRTTGSSHPLPHPADGGGGLLAGADRPAARGVPGGRSPARRTARATRCGSSACAREFPDLAVFSGSERFLLDALRWGGAGCIWPR